MIEEMLTPPNVRNSEGFDEEFNGEKVRGYLSERQDEGLDAALLGVPDYEEDVYLEQSIGALEEIGFNGTVYAMPDYVEDVEEALDVNVEEIDYDGSGSRAEDLEALEELRDEGRNLLMFTTDYNVPRTSFEASKRLGLEGLDDGYLTGFDGFDDFRVSPWKGSVKGALHSVADLKGFTRPLHSVLDYWPGPLDLESGEDFDYSVRGVDGGENSYMVAGASVVGDDRVLQRKLSMERFKNNDSGYWQRVKDLGKDLASRFTDIVF
ncbi:MAG: hypothetical protein ABEJ93_02390 [Candidatus Nanohalobium sp.]